jgi:hypothetical protein
MAGNGDMKAHVATYSSVTALLKWGAVSCFIIALLVVWAIS